MSNRTLACTGPLPKCHFYENQSIDLGRMTIGSKLKQSVSLILFKKLTKQLEILLSCESKVNDPQTGITLAQNFRATSRIRPGDLERCFNKQGNTRLHVAAVLTC